MNKICYWFGHKKFELNKSPDRSNYHPYICPRCKETYQYSDTSKFEDTFWKSDTWDTIKMITCGIISILGAIFIIYAILTLFSIPSCIQYAKMGIETKWNFWTMCMAHHPKFGWVPVDEYFKILNLYTK